MLNHTKIGCGINAIETRSILSIATGNMSIYVTEIQNSAIPDVHDDIYKM